jgi:hypothetical protein
MAELENRMANLKVADGDSSDSDNEDYITFDRALFNEDTYTEILNSSDDYYDMIAVKNALTTIWSGIERNALNNSVGKLSFPYKSKKDVSKSHYKKKDYWLSFLNQFFCASLIELDITLNEKDREVLKERESQIGLTSTQRNGNDGWFNRLCFGVKIETNVVIEGKPVLFDDEDYQPFLSSRDTFEERFKSLMFDLVDLDCHPSMQFALPGARSPYAK